MLLLLLLDRLSYLLSQIDGCYDKFGILVAGVTCQFRQVLPVSQFLPKKRMALCSDGSPNEVL